MAYTADINIVVKGQAAVNSLQKSLIAVGEKLDDLAKKRIGPAATLETFNKQLREARSRLDEVVAGTTNETAAIKNYVTALGNANAASERQNRLINDEIKAREAATGQLEKLIARQQDFIVRTDAAAQAAHRQTAEFIRQQRIAKELAKLNANAPAPQLLLAPAAPGAPAMGGGARSQITGPVERLGGARTQDQADMALRFAQALKQQIRPLSQIEAIYAGIATEAAAMQRIKALPDTAMLNAAARGIKSLEVSQDRYNRELAESAEQLRRLDRLEASRARRAEKLSQRAAYYGQTPSGGAMPAVSPGGQKRGQGGVNRLESIALGVGFPLLFGGGAGEIAGSFLGSFAGKGFGGQILGGALGGILDDFITKAGELGAALNPLTADVDALVTALGGATTSAGAYVAKLEELGRSEEALAAATEELKNLVGVEGVEALQEFGADSTKLQSVFTQAMTQMQASVASLINSTGILKALTAGIERNVLLRQALQSKDPRQQEALRQREQASGPAFLGADPEAYFAAEEQLIKNQRLINEEKQKQYENQLKILTAEEKQVEITKETKKLAQELKTAYSEITSEARKRIETEQAAIDRGASITKARYDAEKAFADLDKTRLERAYEYAQTQQQRYNIAVALFNNAVQQAQLEYQQQLESIAAAERKLQIELQELRVTQEKIQVKAKEAELSALQQKDEQTRAALLKQIQSTTQQALDTNGRVITEVEKQLSAQQQIGAYQQQAAEAQLQNKLLSAQTALEQKLVSEEIGLSQEQARRLGESMRIVKEESILTTNETQQIVGVIEVGTEKTYIMARAMSDVASQAANAAYQIGAAVNAQLQLNAARQASAQSSAPQQAAEGAYWSGGFKAFADGGVVSKPTLGLVGEGGEPEYIIPASKMDEAMSRYANGQRGSSVIPSSINPQVNVTTGPVMNMNGSNYVSQSDFLAGMQTASRRGAEMALQMLGGSSQARRMAGIG